LSRAASDDSIVELFTPPKYSNDSDGDSVVELVNWGKQALKEEAVPDVKQEPELYLELTQEPEQEQEQDEEDEPMPQENSSLSDADTYILEYDVSDDDSESPYNGDDESSQQRTFYDNGYEMPEVPCTYALEFPEDDNELIHIMQHPDRETDFRYDSAEASVDWHCLNQAHWAQQRAILDSRRLEDFEL
jgi:hypothetical protein